MDQGVAIGKKIVRDANIIILDIEGTTTSISFVLNELFPYFKIHFKDYIQTHWDEDELKDIFNILKNDEEKLKNQLKEHHSFVSMPNPACDESEISDYQEKVIGHISWQFERDFKTTGLKRLQGLVWKEAYDKGLIKGHVYDDVSKALSYWKKIGKKIFIYSSGSIAAQKLLFSNSAEGNLCTYIDGYFDTTIGSKVEPESYIKIAAEVVEKPENIVFFTDRPKEVAAAKKSGMKVIRVERAEYNHYLIEEEEFLGKEDATVKALLPIVEE